MGNNMRNNYGFPIPEFPQWYKKNERIDWLFIIAIGLVCVALFFIILFFVILSKEAHAEDIDINRLCNAIYFAEGGVKTRYPYGIKSLKYENRSDKTLTKEQWARKICINTIRNHIKRHAQHNCGKDFISCLGSRYAPVSDSPLNRNWVRNVRRLYENLH